MKSFVLVPLSLCLALASSARQDDAPRELRRSDLRMVVYHPEHGDPRELFDTANALLGGGGLQIATSSGGSEMVDTLFPLGRKALVLYDTPEGVERKLEMLRSLDQELQRAGSAAPPATASKVYRPRYMSVEDARVRLMNLLQETPLQVSTSEPAGILSLRGPGPLVDEALSLLKETDQRQPETLLRCYLIQPTAAAEQEWPMPAELRAGLVALTGFEEYWIRGFGMLRASLDPRSPRTLNLVESVSGSAFHLELVLSAIDPETGDVTLSRCSLTAPGAPEPIFQTSLTVAQGEYVVVSASGGETLLLALQCTREAPRPARGR